MLIKTYVCLLAFQLFLLGELDAGCNWTEVVRNVVGEMQISVLLRRHGGKPAAAGWDGDTFAAFVEPGLKLTLNDYLGAQASLTTFLEQSAPDYWKDCDVLATPTIAVPPFSTKLPPTWS